MATRSSARLQRNSSLEGERGFAAYSTNSRAAAQSSSSRQQAASSSSSSSSNDVQIQSIVGNNSNQDENVPAYNDAHRLLIQFLMSRQLVTEAILQETINTIVAGYPTYRLTPTIEDFTTKINEKLSTVFMEVRRQISEIDGLPYWALVNTRSDETAFNASPFNAHEIAYFKAIMQAIVKSKNGEITAPDCLGLGREINLKKDQKHDVIQRLITDQWLAEPSERSKNLTLGVRSFLELRPFFEEEDLKEDITECTVCHEMVIRGEVCTNENCKAKLHKHCSARWFRNQERKCPSCGAAWRG